MFTSLGLFKNIECPNQDQCKLLACIFLHSDLTQSSNPQSQKYDPLNFGSDEQPPAKRLKAEHDSSVKIDTVSRLQLVESEKPQEPEEPPKPQKPEQPEQPQQPQQPEQPEQPRSERPNEPGKVSLTKCEVIKDAIGQIGPRRSIDASSIASRNIPASQTPPKSSQVEKIPRPLTATKSRPPSLLKSQIHEGSKKPSPPKKEELIPRNVPSQPVQFGKRDEILKKFYAQLQSKDKTIAGNDPELKKSMLSEQELIKYALDFEQEAATRFEGSVYQSHIGRQMVLFKKMSANEWKTFVRDVIRKKVDEAEQGDSKSGSRTLTGLESHEQEIIILRSLRTSLAGLEQFGYVTTAPTGQQIASAKEAADLSAGWEECDRCNTRFRVFPGRDEEGRLTSGGKCRFHWARPKRPQVSKAERIAGGGQVSYPCCGQSPGSDGCTVAESHVFCVKDPCRLASILQFESTAVNANSIKEAVSFDCEMGYTTLGMEVIRVTAVFWPSGKELLDFLVRPYGEILDFNTRFSGVTTAQFAEAAPYMGRTPANERSGALSIVESPAAARQLLFDLIGPETPLIGHSIDNDLNTLRIIHPLVVDTALLYPHPKGLPVRFSLKVLAKQYLDRDIQTRAAEGHDSKEDAVATGDLVTLKVKEMWKKMRMQGWKFDNATLVPPQVKRVPASA